MADREARAARRGAAAAVNHREPVHPAGNDAVREENRERRKEREPPLFQGESHEDAVDWLFRYQKISRYNGWNVEEQLHNFGIYLEGVARR